MKKLAGTVIHLVNLYKEFTIPILDAEITTITMSHFEAQSLVNKSWRS